MGAATAEGELDAYYQQGQEFEQAITLLSRSDLETPGQEYTRAVDQVLELDSWSE